MNRLFISFLIILIIGCKTNPPKEEITKVEIIKIMDNTDDVVKSEVIKPLNKNKFKEEIRNVKVEEEKLIQPESINENKTVIEEKPILFQLIISLIVLFIFYTIILLIVIFTYKKRLKNKSIEYFKLACQANISLEQLNSEIGFDFEENVKDRLKLKIKNKLDELIKIDEINDYFKSFKTYRASLIVVLDKKYLTKWYFICINI